MEIQTITKVYKVIRKLSENDDVEAYLCKEAHKVSKERYLILGLMGQNFSKKFVPYFMELSKKWQEGDFIDCFASKGGLRLVFSYHEYPSVQERMEQEFLLEERLEASRTMMERIVTWNLPCYLQYEGLNLDNVVISSALEVYFNFLLQEPELIESCRFMDMQERLADCLELLFAPELKEGICEQLTDFITELSQREYNGYMGIYRDYRVVYQALAQLKDSGKLKGESWLIKMWEALKKFGTKLYKILYWAVIAALVGLVIWQCLKPEKLPSSRVEFEQIGSLKLRDKSVYDEENLQ